MERRPLGRSGLRIAPLVFGANVFGWTVDQALCLRLLDRFVDAGLDAIDTADVYSRWVPGNQGGESETMIGHWLKGAPSRRDRVVLITKVGMAEGPDGRNLSRAAIRAAIEGSLRRLQTDHVDLYLAHKPDAATPVEETLRAFEDLVREGKVRALGSSNSTAATLGEALAVAKDKGLPRYEVEQPEYNLIERGKFDGPLRDLCLAEGIGVICYYSLAAGFLTGKYRDAAHLKGSARTHVVGRYLNERGSRVLETLDAVAAAHGSRPGEVALAWLIAREGITAPIASATSLEQLEGLIRATSLRLSGEELARLASAGNCAAA